jgi:WD40 repeat protein
LSLINSFQGHLHGIQGIIKQSPFYNSNYVATFDDETIKIWSIFDWSLIRTLKHKWVDVVEWLDQDTLASCGGDDQTITIWSISTGEKKRNITFRNGSYSRVYNLELLSNKIHLAVCFNNDINIFNINDGSLVSSLYGHTGTVFKLIQINKSDLLASSSSDQTVRIWNSTTNTCKFILTGQGSIRDLKEINSEILAGSAGGPIKMWNITSGALIRNLEGSKRSSLLVFIKERQQQSSASSTLVSVSHENIIKVWNWTNGECLKTIKIHGSKYASLAVINPVSNADYQTGMIFFSFL